MYSSETCYTLVASAARFLKCFWPIWNVMHQRVKHFITIFKVIRVDFSKNWKELRQIMCFQRQVKYLESFQI